MSGVRNTRRNMFTFHWEGEVLRTYRRTGGSKMQESSRQYLCEWEDLRKWKCNGIILKDLHPQTTKVFTYSKWILLMIRFTKSKVYINWIKYQKYKWDLQYDHAINWPMYLVRTFWTFTAKNTTTKTTCMGLWTDKSKMQW